MYETANPWAAQITVDAKTRTVTLPSKQRVSDWMGAEAAKVVASALNVEAPTIVKLGGCWSVVGEDAAYRTFAGLLAARFNATVRVPR